MCIYLYTCTRTYVDVYVCVRRYVDPVCLIVSIYIYIHAGCSYIHLLDCHGGEAQPVQVDADSVVLL